MAINTSYVQRDLDTMCSGGIYNPLSVIEQLTYPRFIKRLDALPIRKECEAAQTGLPIDEPAFDPGHNGVRCSRFM